MRRRPVPPAADRAPRRRTPTLDPARSTGPRRSPGASAGPHRRRARDTRGSIVPGDASTPASARSARTSGTASAPPTTRIDSGAFVASAAAAASASGPTRRVSSSTAHGRKPVRAAIASGPVSVSASGVRAREPTQDGVDEPLRAARHEIDRRGDGGVRRDAGAQLVGAEPQGVPRLGRRHAVERPARRALDRRVEREPATQRAERELGRERAVARVQPRARQQRRQEPVRVRAVVDHAADHLEGDRPRGGRGHPRRSPSANRTPRAHAAASIRLRPAGATSTSRTPPPPARTRTPRSSTPTTVPGAPSLRW